MESSASLQTQTINCANSEMYGSSFHLRNVAVLLANTSSTRRNQLESPLLRLPAELRNAVYTYACSSNKIRVSHAKEEQSLKPSTNLAIIHTSRQIRYEPTGPLCSHATFDLRHILFIANIPWIIGQERSRLLTSIELEGSVDCFLVSLRLQRVTEDFPNVRRILVRCREVDVERERVRAALKAGFLSRNLEFDFEGGVW
jgi:hypothetical protein